MAAGGALLATAAVVLAAGLPVVWLLLGTTTILALAVLIPAWRDGRYFEPLPVIAAMILFYFVTRTFQLLVQHDDLYSWFGTPSAVNMLLALDNQEIARFVTTKLAEPLEPAMTRAVAATTVFMGAVTIGYYLPLGRRAGRRLSRLGRNTDRAGLDATVVACLALGLVGQIAVLARAGGPSAAANNMIHQQGGHAGLVLFTMASFAPVGVLIWAAWRRPSTRRAWLAFALAALEVCGFYMVIGSRGGFFALVLVVAVSWHYLWRPWRLRAVVAAAVLFVVLSGALLGVRQGTTGGSISKALSDAPAYILDPRGILADNTQFDTLFILTSDIGHGLHFKDGGWMVDAVRANLPAAVDPGKPQPGDIAFRKSIWGNEVGAGRPITLIGDLYYDFGFAGVALGALLFGILGRALLGLVGPGPDRGRIYRATLYAIGVFLVYSAVSGTYSLTISLLISFVAPFLVAVHLFARVPLRLGRPLTTGRVVPDDTGR